jgi:hypothetical protein
MRQKAVWCGRRIAKGQLVALLTAIVLLATARFSAAQAVPLQPGAAASAPRPPAPIAAAKDVAGKVDAAHQKNAEALEPTPAPPAPAAAASLPNTQAASAKPVLNQAPGNPNQPAAAGAAAAPASPAYSYEPNGRRDPFVSLLYRGGDTHPTGATRPPGLPGQLVGELNLKGILKSKGGYIAILQGSDNKTYIGRPGDRVLDGSIKSIVPDAVVFSQDVNDPLSLVKQREVRKAIRPETK